MDNKFISKINLNGVQYEIKDSYSREKIENIYDQIAGGINYIGKTTTELQDQATISTIMIDGESIEANVGDLVIYNTLEFIFDGEKWAELGSTGSLKSLAFKDSASTNYTPSGTISADTSVVETQATLETNSYTPTGVVTGTVVPSGQVNLQSDAEGYQITGSNTQSNVTITPVVQQVIKSVDTNAVLPTFTEGQFTPASCTNSTITAAVEGIVAAYSDSDEELVLTSATTATASHITNFNGGSKEADTFTPGNVATFNTESVWTGVTSAIAEPQSFTGCKLGATFVGNSNGDSIAATFAGNTVNDAIVTGVSYDKTSVSNMQFVGTQSTITVS